MATEQSTGAGTADSPSSPRPQRGDGQRGRGRGRGRSDGNRGRGGAGGMAANEGRQSSGAGRRGGRGGGANVLSAGDLGARFAGQKSGDVRVENGDKKVEVAKSGEKEGDGVEAEVCWICASPIMHESIAPCNHRTCHICCLRMRALYKDKNCAHCRTPAPYVIFSNNPTKRYEDFLDANIASTDENIGIRYESNDIREDTVLLLRYNCPDDDCDVAGLGWPDLHRHVRSVHHKKICDLCSRHKKVFTHEHELFTDQELQKHMRKGDDNPGAVDQTGFKGHPLCSFCGMRFYGDDELYVHCRDKHERCFICDRTRGGQPQYYLNYEALYEHFRKDHFVCDERECLEKKFIAFDSEIDLKAHQLQEHGNTLSKDVRRDARLVDISSFDYRAPYVQERRGGAGQREQREGRGRGRGRDPNTEPIPASTAQPLRRDEQAFQRQMAIHSAQSVSTRTFGGQLTPAPTPAAARPPAREPASMTVPRPSASVEAATQAVNSLDLSQTDLTPQEQARQLRHRDVIERASLLLQNDPMKITQFRNSISSFKNNKITAPVLIDSFFSLFTDTTSSALGTLIREVADLYEDPKKADTLRTAWNNWRAINEDYPSLPAASGSSSSAIPLNWAVTTASSSSSNTNTNTNTKSTRVLKLKSSTAQSSRSSVSQTRSWGTASPPISSTSSATAPNNPFPTLPPPPTRPNATSTKVSTMPWFASSSAPSSNPGSARPTPPTSRPASRGPMRGSAGVGEFPALPPAAKPQSTIFGYGRGMVRRDGGAQVANAWGAGGGGVNGGGSTGVEESGEGAVEEDGGKGKRKGNKGKKQVLMNWG